MNLYALNGKFRNSFSRSLFPPHWICLLKLFILKLSSDLYHFLNQIFIWFYFFPIEKTLKKLPLLAYDVKMILLTPKAAFPGHEQLFGELYWVRICVLFFYLIVSHPDLCWEGWHIHQIKKIRNMTFMFVIWVLLRIMTTSSFSKTWLLIWGIFWAVRKMSAVFVDHPTSKESFCEGHRIVYDSICNY